MAINPVPSALRPLHLRFTSQAKPRNHRVARKHFARFDTATLAALRAELYRPIAIFSPLYQSVILISDWTCTGNSCPGQSPARHLPAAAAPLAAPSARNHDPGLTAGSPLSASPWQSRRATMSRCGPGNHPQSASLLTRPSRFQRCRPSQPADPDSPGPPADRFQSFGSDAAGARHVCRRHRVRRPGNGLMRSAAGGRRCRSPLPPVKPPAVNNPRSRLRSELAGLCPMIDRRFGICSGFRPNDSLDGLKLNEYLKNRRISETPPSLVS